MENKEKAELLNEQPNKPEWLRKLEEESWQAKLVISGIAIFGALQFPFYIDQMIDWSIGYFQPKDYFFAFIFFLYLTCASTFLIICFVAHFILRTVWIGMLGLNYVFPKGINFDFKSYSPLFMKELEKRFPNNHQDILRLERACSAMFGITITAMIVLISLNINILIIFGIKQLLENFVSSQLLNVLSTVLIVLFFLIMFSVLVMNLKRFHQDEKIQGFYFKSSQVLNKIVYHIFYYPITRITYLFVTNSSIKGFMVSMTLVFFLVGSLSIQQFKNTNILHLARESRLHDYYKRTDRIYPQQYEENLTGSDKVFSAVIPSEKIEGDLMKVFIPILSNESSVIDSLCGEWEENKALSKEQNRDARRKFSLDCYQNYHQIYVNDSLYTSELMFYNHPNQGEAGVLTYLPTQNFKLGKNVLRIEKVNVEKKSYRTMNVNFWFSNN